MKLNENFVLRQIVGLIGKYLAVIHPKRRKFLVCYIVKIGVNHARYAAVADQQNAFSTITPAKLVNQRVSARRDLHHRFTAARIGAGELPAVRGERL